MGWPAQATPQPPAPRPADLSFGAGARTSCSSSRQRGAEIRLPVGAHAAGGDQDPNPRGPRRPGWALELHRRLVEEAVLLTRIAGPAGGPDVLPGMGAAPLTGHDVV